MRDLSVSDWKWVSVKSNRCSGRKKSENVHKKKTRLIIQIHKEDYPQDRSSMSTRLLKLYGSN